MAIVFGWGGGKPQDQGAAVPILCPNCGNFAMWRYAISRKWFRLYFIPLIPYDSKHFLVCPICMNAKQLLGAERQRAKQMVAVTTAFNGGQIPEDRYVFVAQGYIAGNPVPSVPELLALPPPAPAELTPATPAPLAAAPSLPADPGIKPIPVATSPAPPAEVQEDAKEKDQAAAIESDVEPIIPQPDNDGATKASTPDPLPQGSFPITAQTRFCSACGEAAPPGMRFCHNCGARLSVEVRDG
jgi:hypothetical protein